MIARSALSTGELCVAGCRWFWWEADQARCLSRPCWLEGAVSVWISNFLSASITPVAAVLISSRGAGSWRGQYSQWPRRSAVAVCAFRGDRQRAILYRQTVQPQEVGRAEARIALPSIVRCVSKATPTPAPKIEFAMKALSRSDWLVVLHLPLWVDFDFLPSWCRPSLSSLCSTPLEHLYVHCMPFMHQWMEQCLHSNLPRWNRDALRLSRCSFVQDCYSISLNFESAKSITGRSSSTAITKRLKIQGNKRVQTPTPRPLDLLGNDCTHESPSPSHLAVHSHTPNLRRLISNIGSRKALPTSGCKSRADLRRTVLIGEILNHTPSPSIKRIASE